MVTYSEKLRDPRWQRVRIDVWRRAGCMCEACGNDKESLEVHHCYYEKGKEPWDYPHTCFLLLCESCHSEWHEEKQKLDKTLAEFYTEDIMQARGLLTGFKACNNHTDVRLEPAQSLFIDEVVRGYWPPTFYQTALIDCAISKTEAFWLADIVAEVVPIHEEEFYWLGDWHKNAVATRKRGTWL